MSHEPTFRQLVLSILTLWYDLGYKELGAAAGMSQDSIAHLLRRGRAREIKQETFDRVVAAMQPRAGAVEIATACVEGLAGLTVLEGTEEELAILEQAALEAARIARSHLRETIHGDRSPAARFSGYPLVNEVASLRLLSNQQWTRLEILPISMCIRVASVAVEFQNWALCEKVCAVSVETTSSELEEAAALAKLAQEIADRVDGPEWWRRRIRGYAIGHVANVLRVSGELDAAESRLLEARELWSSGFDPDRLLDPGRLLELEASLRRDQRRFPYALALLKDCFAVSDHKGRVLIVKGFTFEVMGKYGDAIGTLLQAEPLEEVQGDPRLLYMARFNLAVNHTHLGRYDEAVKLLHQVREAAVNRGDQNELIRVTWLEGRIAAGLGETTEALRLLEDARKAFASRNMAADSALALLEQAALLLDAGLTVEARTLAQELTPILRGKSLHREALAALRLFKKATGRQTASAELARRVLRFLFRARYDQGLRFSDSA